nr:two-component regulator propeller domain-containing protein [Nonlabens ulvanivorans]
MAFLNAQEPVRIIIDEKVGLPSNEVYAIQEDSKGFVWLATNKGLIRYDGTSFKNYKHPEQRGLSIFEPFVDDKDRIWCMNISGQIFYTNGNNFELFTDLKDDLNGSLASIVVNKEYLVVSTFLKNIVVNLKTKEKRIEMFRKDNYDISFNYGFNKKYDQQLFQSLNEHIRIFESGAFKDFKRLPKDLIENEQRPEPIQLLKNGTGDFFILQQIRFKKPKFFWFKNDAWIELLVPDSFNNTRIIMPRFIDDRLWCTTDKGLFVFSINGDVLKQDAHYLKNHFTTDLFQDTDLNIWVSSLRKGLVVLPNIYVAKINLDQNLPKRLTATGNHELMIGFESGDVVQFNTQTQDQKLIDIPTPSSISNISYDVRNNRTFLFQKTHNYLYNNKEESFIKIENTIANVKDAAVVKSDTLIAALSGILIASSFQNNQFNKHNNYSFKKEKRGYAVLYDSITNTQYFAAVDGLYYKKNNSDLQLITYKGESLLTKKLLQDRQGNIWQPHLKMEFLK